MKDGIVTAKQSVKNANLETPQKQLTDSSLQGRNKLLVKVLRKHFLQGDTTYPFLQVLVPGYLQAYFAAKCRHIDHQLRPASRHSVRWHLLSCEHPKRPFVQIKIHSGPSKWPSGSAHTFQQDRAATVHEL